MQKFLHLNQALLLPLLVLLLALSLCLAGMNNNTRLPSFLSLSLSHSLIVPPNIDDALTSSDVIVREGDNVTLRCKAKGSPEPSIKWKRDDNHKIVINKTLEGKFQLPLDAGPSSRPSHQMQPFLIVAVNDLESDSLELERISRLHMGAYLCIASNGVPPSVSKRIKVSVDCKSSWPINLSLSLSLALSVSLQWC